MSLETLDQTFSWVFASGLVHDPFTLLWHAGEPTVVPVSFYQHASELLDKHNRQGVPIQQSFQTNATLLNREWCDFIKSRDIQIGVSVDGPDYLHDRCRQTRTGQGTLARVLRGMELLHELGIPFYVITVLTADSLQYADELFDFYLENRINSVCFNVEEIEGPNTSSSLAGPGIKEGFRRFLARFVKLAKSADPPLAVREFDTSAGALLGVRYGPESRTQENKPWAIVNVDCDGNFSTYSPELLGLSSPRYGNFALGNVANDSLADVMASERFLALEEEIGQGVELCRQQCAYFPFCGGGPPANKYFENGTFASTETLFCRLHKQVCLDVALERLERERTKPADELELAAPASPSAEASPGVFQLPRHLLTDWLSMLERCRDAGMRNLPGFNHFAGKVAEFLAYKDFAVPQDVTFEVHVGKDLADLPQFLGAVSLGMDVDVSAAADAEPQAWLLIREAR
jgi:uncharacterized protein